MLFNLNTALTFPVSLVEQQVDSHSLNCVTMHCKPTAVELVNSMSQTYNNVQLSRSKMITGQQWFSCAILTSPYCQQIHITEFFCTMHHGSAENFCMDKILVNQNYI